MLPISRMASNLRVDELGSSSAVVSWDSESNGTVYTLDLQDTGGNTLASVETEETSVTFEDLTQGTSYVFKLFTQQTVTTASSPSKPKYKSVRFVSNRSNYTTLVEVEVYNVAGLRLTSGNFAISSSTIYKSYAAVNAMNGNSDTSTYKNGAVMTPESGNYWEAVLKTPIEISQVKVFYWYSYAGFLEEAHLEFTDADNNKSLYELSGVAEQTITVA